MHLLRRTLCGLAAVASLAALPGAAAAADGSYTATTWASPDLFAARLWDQGGVITPPASVPGNAVITSVYGNFTWNSPPATRSQFEGLLCDYADGEHDLSPAFFSARGCVRFGQSLGQSWDLTTRALAGKPAATTELYLAAQVNDFSTSPVHDLLSPNRSLTFKQITVNYSDPTAIGDIGGVKLNEIESDGDATNGDWVELVNTTGAAIDVDGAIVTDSDPSHRFVVPASTPTLPAGGYVAFRVDDPAVAGSFDLGSADAARLYAPNDLKLRSVVDQLTWVSHAAVTWGRTPAGTGTWGATAAGTFAAVNQPRAGLSRNLRDIGVNEVESYGDVVNGDWIELYNSGDAIGVEIDLSGAILSDDDNRDRFVIPAGTTLDVGEWTAFRVDDPAVPGSFDLDAADAARLFPAGTVDLGSATPSDRYSWTSHAPTTYGADPDGGSSFAVTAAGTFGDANDFALSPIRSIAGVKLNEVETDGDATNGDWVELVNTTGAAIDIDGAIVTDSDPSHQFVVPASTPTLPAGGYAAFRVDDVAVATGFDLDQADAAKLYAPHDVTLTRVVDQFSWWTHPVNTWGRTLPGAGSWQATAVGTFAAANVFRAVAAPDLTGVVINEVESHGDDVNGDWIELKNTTRSSVTLDDAILTDGGGSDIFRVPVSTPDLAPGAVAAFRVDDPALGSAQLDLEDADTVGLFRADAIDLSTQSPISSRSWSMRAQRTYGLDDGGLFAATRKGTFGAANDFSSAVTPDLSDVVLNEVVSHGDAVNGDWVELLNTANSTVDVGGMIIADSSDANTYAIPAGTRLAPGRTYVLRTAATASFDLDVNDAVRLYRRGATVGRSIPLDHYEWDRFVNGSDARESNGFGAWALNVTPTYNAAN